MRFSVGWLFFICYVLCALLTVHVCHGADGTFSWLPTDDSAITKGYEIHWGTATREYTNTINVGMPNLTDGKMQYTVAHLPEGIPLFFAASAYGINGNLKHLGEYSNEVVHTFPSTIPAQPSIVPSFKFEGIITPIPE